MPEPSSSDLDPVQTARAAGLRYLMDASPGIRRQSRGKSFAYRYEQGGKVTDAATLDRIKSLAIPPAWTDVWISPRPEGHLQATGRDARGRKQYRYHPWFRASRDATKFGRMIAFGRKLPLIRRRVRSDLKLPGTPREKVLAGVVRLLEQTLIRVGNDEYARTNKSYGLTTMRNGHARVYGDRVRFEFRGKSGIRHAVSINDPLIARLVRRCQDLPGQDLFTYVNGDGKPASIGSEDVNEYLRGVTGDDFTAKDFRTWAGTVLALGSLRRLDEFKSATEAKRNVVAVIAKVASEMGNTPAVCRKCYVHPLVIERYLEGALNSATKPESTRGLRGDERGAILLLRGAAGLRKSRGKAKAEGIT